MKEKTLQHVTVFVLSFQPKEKSFPLSFMYFINPKASILPRDGVIMDGFWICNRIY
jgi:hypothetical protein